MSKPKSGNKTGSKKKRTTGQPEDKVVVPRPLHPLTLFRPHRLAALLGVNPSTVWRWRQQGVLPAPVEIAGIHGWTQQQIEEVLKRRGMVA
jgi:predicted DNA-binding transcriptional regulator AlpA